ncbi:hypothetical protein [Chryseobacterium sp.]|uniref:hypothetical protein n=1 Tax=Chryseobacterium sp. TaxID=1871047 RepID=UPI0011CACDDB|nr:hypothetical protein [Chryseobacterium sp.]TXF77471.1 hypothetical protein FUA25_05960 [Chryseobacterium sp.]
MNMKKGTLFLNLAFAFFSAMAAGQNSGEVSLKINLYPIQTIVVNAGTNTADLDYKTLDDYKNGVSITKEDHLKIFSTGGFTVRVKTISPTLTNTLNGSSIDAGDITVTVSKGTTNGIEGLTYSSIPLSNTDTELISSPFGGNNKTFNINYAAKGEDKYVNKYMKAQTPTVYTTQVVYSIVVN